MYDERPLRPSILLALALLASLSACDEGGGGPLPGNDPVQGTTCAPLNTTTACQCGSDPGSRSCLASGWSPCQCASAPDTLIDGGTEAGPDTGFDGPVPTPPGNLRSDIVFDWERTQPSDASCEPGFYEGTFWGLYASSLTFVGAPIPVAALGTPLRPGLAFTLEQSADGELLEISDGWVEGTADGLFPFAGTLTGTLDCETLKFEAELDGYYSLGLDGIGMFRFVGPVTADYDMQTHSMVNGTWDLKEYDPPSALDNAGGWGEWDATWSP